MSPAPHTGGRFIVLSVWVALWASSLTRFWCDGGAGPWDYEAHSIIYIAGLFPLLTWRCQPDYCFLISYPKAFALPEIFLGLKTCTQPSTLSSELHTEFDCIMQRKSHMTRMRLIKPSRISLAYPNCIQKMHINLRTFLFWWRGWPTRLLHGVLNYGLQQGLKVVPPLIDLAST